MSFNPFASKKKRAAGKVSTRRSRGRKEEDNEIDWANVPASLRKLAPGGAGGKGSQEGWFPTEKKAHQLATPSPNVPKKLFKESSERKPCPKPPPPSRSIIDNESTCELINSSTVCRHCHSDLQFTLPTCCITAIPTVQCSNEKCKKPKSVSVSPPTKIPRGFQQTMTDFAINVLFV